MTNFILIAICIGGGMLFRRSGALPPDAHKGINAWIINFALPAVSFKYLPHVVWTNSLLLPVVSPIVVWLGSWLLIRVYAWKYRVDKKTEGGLKLAAGLSNTTFIGFPLIMAYYGEQQLGIGIIYDQVNFMLLSTAGVIVAVHSARKEALSPLLIVRRVLRFPPFLGCVAALVLSRFIDITPVEPLFASMAATVGPMALFSIGLQLQFTGWREHARHIRVALVYKLLLAPALVFLLALLSGVKGNIPQISVFEAAMPTLLTSGIVADEYGLNPRVVNLVIGIGILLSFVTTVGWWLALHYFNA